MENMAGVTTSVFEANGELESCEVCHSLFDTGDTVYHYKGFKVCFSGCVDALKEAGH